VNDNLWHHVAGVYDGSKVYLYVDGLLDNSEYASGVIDSSSYNVWIGANEEAADREWNGLIDDVRIYDYGLSHAEIVNLTGASDVYQPVLSLANISDEEAKLSKTVNFKDYIVIANNWLEEKLWPWP
jgi:beta-galactosidase